MKFDRRTIMLGAASAALLSRRAIAASATNGAPFDAAAFKAAVAAGRTVIVEITAKWCGPCQRQRPVVAAVLTKREFAGLTVFDADFDAHKNDLLAINAHVVTTLVLYRDGKEVERSSGATTPEAVETFFRKAL